MYVLHENVKYMQYSLAEKNVRHINTSLWIPWYKKQLLLDWKYLKNKQKPRKQSKYYWYLYDFHFFSQQGDLFISLPTSIIRREHFWQMPPAFTMKHLSPRISRYWIVSLSAMGIQTSVLQAWKKLGWSCLSCSGVK